MRLTRFIAGSIGGIVAAGIFVPRLTHAQGVTSTIDMGAARMRYGGTLAATTATLSPSVRVEWPRAVVASSGSVSAFSGGTWSAQGALSASGFTRTVGPLSGELFGSLGGSAHEDGTRTEQTTALARVYLGAQHIGAWGGAGVGRMWDGAVWRGVREADLGAWGRRGAVTAVASLTPTTVDDTIRYVDAQVSAELERRVWDLSATGGVRSGAHVPTLGGHARRWGSLTALAWLRPTVALRVAVGTYPVDLTQGFPGGRFVAMGMHLQPSRTTPVSSRGTDTTSAVSAGVRQFQVRAANRGLRELRVQAPTATSVEIRGDITLWETRSLMKSGDGWWTTTLDVPSGTHEVNVRIDGGAWSVPPGLGVLTDELGVRTGLLVVE